MRCRFRPAENAARLDSSRNSGPPNQKRIDVRFNFNHVGPGLILRTDFIGMETYPVEGCYPATPATFVNSGSDFDFS